MTKAEVVTEIANKTGVEKAAVSEVVESFFTVVKDSMRKGGNVYFRGFGSFILKNRARKVARNIAKNTSIIIEPHAIPAFKPAKTFVGEIKNSVKSGAKKTKKAPAKK
ncbi:MAG: integration host factor subunit beta [Bacteroidota bacterium]|nr:integration host factor subunit beta [Bacteroidota bacterium]